VPRACHAPLAEFYERSWERATGPDSLLARPNFYVHVPNRTDPTAAPQGCDSVMVRRLQPELLPVPCTQGSAKTCSNKHHVTLRTLSARIV
jgi:phytoene dehydrogenase-like protein